MALVQDFGHLILEVGDMDEALRLYRDILGLAVERKADPVWTVLTTKGGAVTLYRRTEPVPCVLANGGSPVNLHVMDFEAAADALERSGYAVDRQSANGGSLKDPWGNVLRLHDHREG